MKPNRMAVVIVSLVEKTLGTGFDPETDMALVQSISEYLGETLADPRPPTAPDAFLEASYEDRVSGFLD